MMLPSLDDSESEKIASKGPSEYSIDDTCDEKSDVVLEKIITTAGYEVSVNSRESEVFGNDASRCLEYLNLTQEEYEKDGTFNEEDADVSYGSEEGTNEIDLNENVSSLLCNNIICCEPSNGKNDKETSIIQEKSFEDDHVPIEDEAEKEDMNRDKLILPDDNLSEELLLSPLTAIEQPLLENSFEGHETYKIGNNAGVFEIKQMHLVIRHDGRDQRNCVSLEKEVNSSTACHQVALKRKSEDLSTSTPTQVHQRSVINEGNIGNEQDEKKEEIAEQFVTTKFDEELNGFNNSSSDGALIMREVSEQTGIWFHKSYDGRSLDDTKTASSLTNPGKIGESGHVLARLSRYSQVSKLWRPIYWIRYGTSCVLIFRSRSDFDQWFFNTSYTEKKRASIVLQKIDFINDLSKRGIMGFRLSKLKSKRSKRSSTEIHKFKVESGTISGVQTVVSFSSPSTKEIESLRRSIEQCLCNIPGEVECLDEVGNVAEEDFEDWPDFNDR